MLDRILIPADEIWRPVVGYEDYEVSNMGRVRRAKPGKGARAGIILKPIPACSVTVHLRVSLHPGQRTSTIHRLVLLAFVGPCPEGMECCHNDGDPANNALSNLRWDTRRANAADSALHGGMLRGSRCPWAKLTEADVDEIRSAYAKGGVTQRYLAKKYNVTQNTISCVVNRKRWRHVME